MPLHSDNESCIAAKTWILIISIGASKKLYLKDSTSPKKFYVPVNNGDIVAMSNSSQSRIRHKVLPGSPDESNSPRVSLTFRQII